MKIKKEKLVSFFISKEDYEILKELADSKFDYNVSSVIRHLITTNNKFLNKKKEIKDEGLWKKIQKKQTYSS